VIRTLHAGFLESATRTPNGTALFVNGTTVTYGQLRAKAAALAATLQQGAPAGAPPLTAILAERSEVAFAAILGALFAGHGYVPLNISYPTARTRRMLQRSGSRTLIVGAEAEAQLADLLAECETTLLIVLPERDDVRPLAERWPHHTFVGHQDVAAAAGWHQITSASNDVAYLLFTSGSTGVPKGVGVTHANIAHFVQAMAQRYGIVSSDRFSQMFDTTFDLSVFDMFVAWHAGASVYCPSRATLLNPDQFIRQHRLTVWFSVPTVAMIMDRLGSLQPDRYPSLRWSLFCGEALPVALAEAWSAAAPASVLENLYGPTELTVACTAYRWDSLFSPPECSDGLVPIGVPLNGMQVRVVDDRLVEVAPGQVGELLLAGPQRTPGYWQDDAATSRSFVRLRGDDTIYYRTGDRVRRAAPNGPLCFVGRVDHQIKVLGHRVELEEIECVLRQEPGVRQAVAVGWPQTSTGIGGIAAFVTGNGIDPVALRASARQKLQSYAVPQTIRVLTALPQNASGKVDRQALIGLLQA
jgi:amino acid adenylation domain-containing protein